MGAQDVMTVRLGCALAYEAVREEVILLLLKPHQDRTQALLEEKVFFGNGMPVEQFKDPHGNTVFKTLLIPGTNLYRYEALLQVSSALDNARLPTDAIPIHQLPAQVLRYTFASRYCESDKLGEFALRQFGHLAPGLEQVQAICDWTHQHIAYRFGSGNPSLSASDIIERGYGVCRDFAHVMIALCRALDFPARYVAGHIPYFAGADGDIGLDFQAYCEVYLGGCWHIFDPRYNKRQRGRIKIAHGMDAVDAAFATIYGNAVQSQFQTWSYQPGSSEANLEAPVRLLQDGKGAP